MAYVVLAVGFIMLIKGADLFVDGSSSVAKLFKVPSVIIGLTIVAMGTSAPEAAVSITAGLTGNNEIAISNVIGSNMFNLLIVVGLCAAIKAFASNKDILKRDFPFCIGITTMLFFFVLDKEVSRADGIIFLIIFVAYLVMMIQSALKNRETEQEEGKKLSPVKSVIFIIAGIAAIVFGGDLVVDNASEIAAQFGLSQTLIGLTIVAIGTSLPELVTSIVAAVKGESAMALGNVVGSNIMNILFILGASSAIHPIKTVGENIVDAGLMLVSTIMVYIYCKSGKRVDRGEGIVCVILYVIYTGYIITRSLHLL